MAVNTNEKGASLYLKDNAWANKWFSPGITNRHTPKTKFNFICALWPKKHIMNPSLFRDALDYIHLVKTAEPPKPNFDVEVVDQYNRKRIIQKKIGWDPVTITFHDDYDNQIYHTLIDYMQYHYKDFRNDQKIDWNLDTVTGMINEFDWGYQPQHDKYYFESISLIWLAGGKGTRVSMMNPMITNIQFDQLDYSDGSSPLEIAITLDYEGVRLGSINSEIFTGHRRDDLGIAEELMTQVNDIGAPFDDVQFDPGVEIPGLDRSFGIGELVQAGLTFYGKHNNKPTVNDFVDDFILRPAQGNLSSAINSWGNFNFGGIGTAKSPGLLGTIGRTVGNQVGDVYKVATSGTIIQDIFKFGSGGSSGG